MSHLYPTDFVIHTVTYTFMIYNVQKLKKTNNTNVKLMLENMPLITILARTMKMTA